MTVQLLSEHHVLFLSLKGGCIGSSDSRFVKFPHSWKSHFVAYLVPIAYVSIHADASCRARSTITFFFTSSDGSSSLDNVISTN